MKFNKEKYLLNKIQILESLNFNNVSIKFINKFLSFLLSKTNFSLEIIDEIYKSLIILINYDQTNLKLLKKIYHAFIKLDNLLIDELSEQLNKFENIDFNEYYDKIIFDTFNFFKKFNDHQMLSVGFNVIHELLFNIYKIRNKVSLEVKCRLYIEVLKEINKSLDNDKNTGKIYLNLINICNTIVQSINDWS